MLVSVDVLCALLDCALGFFPCYFLFGCSRPGCAGGDRRGAMCRQYHKYIARRNFVTALAKTCDVALVT